MAERETPKLTLLEQTKIQAQVLVPLLRAFRAELGDARANAHCHSGDQRDTIFKRHSEPSKEAFNGWLQL